MSDSSERGMKDTDSMRREVLSTYSRLVDLNYMVGTWGNISVRIDAGFLITPSRVPYNEMGVDDLVLMSFESKILKGHRLPSSEMHLHRLLLQRRPDIGCLIHSHSPFASAVACAGRSIPVILEDMSQILGGEVSCTAYVRAGTHEELALAACDRIGDSAMAVLLGNHGPIVGGRTLEEAFVAVQILEKAAECLIYTTALGGARAIPQDSIDLERDRYLNKYGTELDASLSHRGKE